MGQMLTAVFPETRQGLEWIWEVSGSSTGSVSADTSALESALETASDELAELQSDLASQKAVAEADSTSLTKEEKDKLEVTDNLSELDAKSAKELVKEGMKGITAEFYRGQTSKKEHPFPREWNFSQFRTRIRPVWM